MNPLLTPEEVTTLPLLLPLLILPLLHAIPNLQLLLRPLLLSTLTMRIVLTESSQLGW